MVLNQPQCLTFRSCLHTYLNTNKSLCKLKNSWSTHGQLYQKHIIRTLWSTQYLFKTHVCSEYEITISAKLGFPSIFWCLIIRLGFSYYQPLYMFTRLRVSYKLLHMLNQLGFHIKSCLYYSDLGFHAQYPTLVARVSLPCKFI